MAYVCDDALSAAVNVAMVLGQPLLVTGEPGSGKTQLAHHLAAVHEFGPPFVARLAPGRAPKTLLYTVDADGYRAAVAEAAKTGAGAQVDPRPFIHFGPLGTALLYTLPPQAALAWTGEGAGFDRLAHPGAAGPGVEETRRSVLLIDDADDLSPDDLDALLDLLEQPHYRVKELAGLPGFAKAAIKPDEDLRPLVMITGRDIDAFPDDIIQRCTAFQIELPTDRDGLAEYAAAILTARVPSLPDELSQDMAVLFADLREPDAGLAALPGIGDLVAFGHAIEGTGPQSGGLLDQAGWRALAQDCLAPGPADKEALTAWLTRHYGPEPAAAPAEPASPAKSVDTVGAVMAGLFARLDAAGHATDERQRAAAGAVFRKSLSDPAKMLKLDLMLAPVLAGHPKQQAVLRPVIQGWLDHLLKGQTEAAAEPAAPEAAPPLPEPAASSQDRSLAMGAAAAAATAGGVAAAGIGRRDVSSDTEDGQPLPAQTDDAVASVPPDLPDEGAGRTLDESHTDEPARLPGEAERADAGMAYEPHPHEAAAYEAPADPEGAAAGGLDAHGDVMDAEGSSSPALDREADYDAGHDADHAASHGAGHGADHDAAYGTPPEAGSLNAFDDDPATPQADESLGVSMVEPAHDAPYPDHTSHDVMGDSIERQDEAFGDRHAGSGHDHETPVASSSEFPKVDADEVLFDRPEDAPAGNPYLRDIHGDDRDAPDLTASDHDGPAFIPRQDEPAAQDEGHTPPDRDPSEGRVIPLWPAASQRHGRSPSPFPGAGGQDRALAAEPDHRDPHLQEADDAPLEDAPPEPDEPVYSAGDPHAHDPEPAAPADPRGEAGPSPLFAAREEPAETRAPFDRGPSYQPFLTDRPAAPREPLGGPSIHAGHGDGPAHSAGPVGQQMPPPPPPEDRPKSGSKLPLIAGGGLAALVLLGAVGAWMVFGRGGDEMSSVETAASESSVSGDNDADLGGDGTGGGSGGSFFDEGDGFFSQTGGSSFEEGDTDSEEAGSALWNDEDDDPEADRFSFIDADGLREDLGDGFAGAAMEDREAMEGREAMEDEPGANWGADPYGESQIADGAFAGDDDAGFDETGLGGPDDFDRTTDEPLDGVVEDDETEPVAAADEGGGASGTVDEGIAGRDAPLETAADETMAAEDEAAAGATASAEPAIAPGERRLVAEETVVRAGPGPDFEAVNTAAIGTRIRVMGVSQDDTGGDWIEIPLTMETSGYIDAGMTVTDTQEARARLAQRAIEPAIPQIAPAPKPALSDADLAAAGADGDQALADAAPDDELNGGDPASEMAGPPAPVQVDVIALGRNLTEAQARKLASDMQSAKSRFIGQVLRDQSARNYMGTIPVNAANVAAFTEYLRVQRAGLSFGAVGGLQEGNSAWSVVARPEGDPVFAPALCRVIASNGVACRAHQMPERQWAGVDLQGAQQAEPDAPVNPEPQPVQTAAADPVPGPAPVEAAVEGPAADMPPAADAAAAGVAVPALGAAEDAEDVALRDAPAEPAAPAPVRRQPGETFRECPTCPQMVVLAPGSFTMGSPETEKGHVKAEAPMRRMQVGSFAVGRYEVTLGQFASFVADTGYRPPEGCLKPSRRSGEWRLEDDIGWNDPGFEQANDHPVVCISWRDAQAYIAWLSRETGHDYRLMSEAEWEYAARAGTQSRYAFGDDEAARDMCDFANNADKRFGDVFKKLVTSNCRDDAVYTAAVGSFRPNRFGLYDMHGNVFEMVEDCLGAYSPAAPRDGSPVARPGCAHRVARGGGWDTDPDRLRAASRSIVEPDKRYSHVGFRVARSLD